MKLMLINMHANAAIILNLEDTKCKMSHFHFQQTEADAVVDHFMFVAFGIVNLYIP